MKKIVAVVLVVVFFGAFAVVAASPEARAEAKRRSKWVVVATNMFQDSLRRTGLRSDQIAQDRGEQRTEADVPAAIVRIDRTFTNYVNALPDSARGFAGKHVLEVGPGDNAGVALRFVGAGAQQVVALDKFVPFRQTSFHAALYGRLRETRSDEERRAMDDAIDVGSGIQLRQPRLEWVTGVGIEEQHAALAPQSFDLIVSNAVLEEVYALDEAFAAMDRLIRRGGYQVHKIDLRDYGMFTRFGYHPLEFLTIRDGIYRYMVESTGQPNRRLVDYYRRKATELGYDARIFITSVLGVDQELRPPRPQLCPCPEADRSRALLREIRPRLLARYQALTDDELAVQGILLVMQKR